MGGEARIPGPLGSAKQVPTDLGGIIGYLRNLAPKILGEAKSEAFEYAEHRVGDLGQIIKDIYGLEQLKPQADEEGNATDIVGEKLPGQRERDARKPASTPGPRLKNPSLKVRLQDAELSPDFSTLTLRGKAKATLEIPSPFPPQFDTPTEIGIEITSASVNASTLGFSGRATAYKVVRADFNLQLHYNSRQLLQAAIRLAKSKNVSEEDVAAMLDKISFDASAVVRAGIPISYVRLSASSLYPMKRPLLGATDELVPVQVAALPDRSVFIGGVQAVPKGVFFDTPVPALGVHYSRFGRRTGFSGTLAGLAKPDLDNLGQFQVFGFLDLHYAKRVSSAVDLNIGLTYTYSPSGSAGEVEPLQFEVLKARSRPGGARGRDNPGDPADRSGHNLMFSIKGTFGE
jgi:hypothetical protein